ncbi:hypothetical protein G7Y89_g7205 [Cudoniella acicularis]|uniref:Uncharacterized protein n=1 Tax=Cudoniella acicularis TaxID=354080 RepID=A0A8H4RKW3_9HELO|nr:hypothetical protein G7Y89_g7205 [Cudoniella acicularis]
MAQEISAKDSTTITKVRPESPSLPGIPLEIRLQIYDYIFHVDSFKCGPMGIMGCHCGEELSRTNRQIYAECRPLYYNRARFVLRDPTKCIKFLDSIGQNIEHLRDLGLRLKNNYSDSALLRNVFERFPLGSNLRHLQLNIYSNEGFGREDHVGVSPPLYWPMNREDSSAVAYDLRYRPASHPLAKLRSLHSLTVTGIPGLSEIEESIYRLSLSIDERGRKERNTVFTSNSVAPCTAWFYRIYRKNLDSNFHRGGKNTREKVGVSSNRADTG